MNIAFYILVFFCGLLGMTFHLFTVKLPSLKAKARAANLHFSILDALAEDAITLIGNLLAIIIVMTLWDEIIGFKPDLAAYYKGTFVLVGFVGSSILLRLFSKVDARYTQAIDIKTNIADAVTSDSKPEALPTE